MLQVRKLVERVRRSSHDVALILIAATIAWTGPFLRYTPFDYGRWLHPWYQHILSRGRITAFAEPFSNYTPPYLYLLSASTLFDEVMPPLIIIKVLSAVGALWIAYSVFVLLTSAQADQPLKGAAWSLLLPTIFFNVPVLAQADGFWVAPSVLAVAAAIRREDRSMVLWASLAFAVKAQAVFLAPFVISVLFNRRSPLWYWALPPLVYATAMTPAWLVGWPATHLATIYFRQVAWVPGDGVPFVSNAGNGWLIFKLVALKAALSSFWVGYALAAAASSALVLSLRRRALSTTSLILAAAISSAMLPWLLPGMHERFFALSEMLAFCLAWLLRNRISVTIAVLMQAGLALAIAGWLLHQDFAAVLAVATVSTALLLMVRALANEHGQNQAKSVTP